MKILFILLTALSLQLGARGYSQGISLSLKNTPLEKLFKIIEQQTDYKFVFTDEAMALAKPVTIDVRNESFKNVLQLCFLNQPLTYTVDEKFIILRISDKRIQDDKTLDIRGKVTGETGEALAGITVTIKGTNNSTFTSISGQFSFKAIDEQSILIFSGVNVESYELPVKGRVSLDVVLKNKVGQLDELHVVAYGVTTQRYNVGSVSNIKSDDLSKQPVSNLLGALEAKVPGLEIIQSSGVPGSSFSIQVRGQNTIRKSNTNIPLDNPLILIDGVPFAPQNGNINQIASLGAAGSNNSVNPTEGISPFSTLNLADIESVEVLRDADATAIYGSRGANGVILITTKKGKPGRTKTDFSVIAGASQITTAMDMMNTTQYLAMRNEAYKNDQMTPAPADAPDLLIFDTTRYTDWKKFLLGNTAATFDANASVSGGTALTQFFAAANYHTEAYVFPGNFSDKRYSVSSNIQHTSEGKKFNVKLSTLYSFDNNNSSNNNFPLRSAFVLPPDYPSLTTADGGINWKYNGFSLATGDASNPLIYLRQPYFIQSSNLLLNLQLGYQIFKDLVFRSSFGYNSYSTNEHSEIPKSAIDPSNVNIQASAKFGSSDFKTWIIEPQAEYKRQIGKVLKINAIIGLTFQQNQVNSTIISGTNFSNDALLGTISGAGNVTASGVYSLYKYSAGFGRLSTIWHEKYILNITGRRDGSSRFGPGKKFGNFGSAAGGWIFSEEKFIKQLFRVLSYGKLHVSYGTSGNDNIGNYQYLPNWGVTGGTLQASVGYLPINLLNPNYSWSVNKKLETGLAIGLLRDRILVDATWYRNRCDNQLLTYQLPSQTGFSGVVENFPGLVQNKGWEFQLSGNIINSKHLTWSSALNLTIPKNTLLSFPNFQMSTYANTYVLGQSLNVISGFRLLGVNDTTGYYQYLTGKGATTYDPSFTADRFPIGDRDPKFYGNFSNTIAFKNFQLFLNFQFVKKTGLNYLGQIASFYMPGIANNNQPVAVLKRWQQPYDRSLIGQFTTTYNGAGNAASYFYASTGAYSDASFVRVKTISLSYDFHGLVLAKLHLQTLRIYANAQNLLTLTNYKGNDPETLSFYGVPPLKTVVFGIQTSF